MSIVSSDTFARANQAGWGTASDSAAWSEKQAGSTLAIASNEGTASGNAAARSIETLDTPGTTDGLVTFRLAIGQTTNQNDIYALLRYTDLSNYYWVGVQWVNSTTINLAIRKRVAGTNTTLTTTATITLTANTFYWLRAMVKGSSLAVKHWQDGGSEPSTWEATASDSALTSGVLWGVAPFTNGAGAKVSIDSYTLDNLAAVNVNGASSGVGGGAATATLDATGASAGTGDGPASAQLRDAATSAGVGVGAAGATLAMSGSGAGVGGGVGQSASLATPGASLGAGAGAALVTLLTAATSAGLGAGAARGPFIAIAAIPPPAGVSVALADAPSGVTVAVALAAVPTGVAGALALTPAGVAVSER